MTHEQSAPPPIRVLMACPDGRIGGCQVRTEMRRGRLSSKLEGPPECAGGWSAIEQSGLDLFRDPDGAARAFSGIARPDEYGPVLINRCGYDEASEVKSVLMPLCPLYSYLGGCAIRFIYSPYSPDKSEVLGPADCALYQTLERQDDMMAVPGRPPRCMRQVVRRHLWVVRNDSEGSPRQDG